MNGSGKGEVLQFVCPTCGRPVSAEKIKTRMAFCSRECRTTFRQNHGNEVTVLVERRICGDFTLKDLYKNLWPEVSQSAIKAMKGVRDFGVVSVICADILHDVLDWRVFYEDDSVEETAARMQSLLRLWDATRSLGFAATDLTEDEPEERYVDPDTIGYL